MTSKRQSNRKKSLLKKLNTASATRKPSTISQRNRDRDAKRLRRAALSLDDLLVLREREALQKRIYRSNLSEEQKEALREKDKLRKRIERKGHAMMRTGKKKGTKKSSKGKHSKAESDVGRTKERKTLSGAAKQKSKRKSVKFA
ncbi:uncharacterized protein LOC142222577 [Haematobia irritans]|uniref:uncharacterized protein LOC142222577 n=1 Tax=Haematobia irritans TaxID=7368 RepID=UPI003F4F6647